LLFLGLAQLLQADQLLPNEKLTDAVARHPTSLKILRREAQPSDAARAGV
jgi:hypothetical protein